MKKDRNCGCGVPYPVYPTAQPGMMPMMPNMGMNPPVANIPNMGMNQNNGIMPDMSLQPNGMITNTIENQINMLTNQVNNLERRVATLESASGAAHYNNSNYQMM